MQSWFSVSAGLLERISLLQTAESPSSCLSERDFTPFWNDMLSDVPADDCEQKGDRFEAGLGHCACVCVCLFRGQDQCFQHNALSRYGCIL